ncbi:hypothetical protein GW17_00039886, partial [Ensete ventricosum]
VFCLSSRKFKIQAIPNIFALRKSYVVSIAEKHDGYKLCAKSHAKSFYFSGESFYFSFVTLFDFLEVVNFLYPLAI